MSRFKPDHTLEQRLKQIRITELFMNLGQLIFLALAALQLTDIANVLQFDFVAYAFSFVVITQFFLMKFLIVPMLKRKANENLPEDQG